MMFLVTVTMAERHFASMYYLFVDESQTFAVELLRW